jgi:hypothetical protein
MSHTLTAPQFASARLLAKQSDFTKRLHAAGYL